MFFLHSIFWCIFTSHMHLSDTLTYANRWSRCYAYSFYVHIFHCMGKKWSVKKRYFFNVSLVRWFLGYSHLFIKKNDNLLLIFDFPTAFLTLYHFDQYVQWYDNDILKKRSTTPWYARHFFFCLFSANLNNFMQFK